MSQPMMGFISPPMVITKLLFSVFMAKTGAGARPGSSARALLRMAFTSGVVRTSLMGLPLSVPSGMLSAVCAQSGEARRPAMVSNEKRVIVF